MNRYSNIQCLMKRIEIYSNTILSLEKCSRFQWALKRFLAERTKSVRDKDESTSLSGRSMKSVRLCRYGNVYVNQPGRNRSYFLIVIEEVARYHLHNASERVCARNTQPARGFRKISVSLVRAPLSGETGSLSLSQVFCGIRSHVSVM